MTKGSAIHEIQKLVSMVSVLNRGPEIISVQEDVTIIIIRLHLKI